MVSTNYGKPTIKSSNFSSEPLSVSLLLLEHDTEERKLTTEEGFNILIEVGSIPGTNYSKGSVNSTNYS